jgi:hypothetical protein
VQRLREMVVASWSAQAIYAAAKLGIADLLASEPKTAAELAAATNTSPDALYRVLRALASVGVFTEVSPRLFAMTPLAEGLRTGVPGSVRHLTMWYGEDVFRAYAEIGHSLGTGQPAFSRVFGADLWTHFARNAESSATYNAGMGVARWTDQIPLVRAYDFAGIRKIVDVGGGQGSMLAAILHENPAMRGVLLDLASARNGHSRHFEDAGVAERYEFVEGSCFDRLPAADAYWLSCLLHALDDERATAALARVREAIHPEGRLLVVERIVPEGDAPSFAKLLDVTMLVVAGGRERTEAEFASLFQRSGFALRRIVQLPYVPAGIGLGILEARPG